MRSLLRRLFGRPAARNAQIRADRDGQAARTKGVVATEAPTVPIFVGDFGQMAPLPATLYDEPYTQPASYEAPLAINPPTVRPYVMGGWAMVGKTKVHRGCADARRDGQTPDRICPHCRPYLVGQAAGLPS